MKADHYLYEDTGRDTEWDAVWTAETTEDQHGWYIELAVPLAAMRFRSQGSDTWGLQFYRWLHGRGEDTGWATWDRDQSGFVSRWGVLTGMQAATSPRRLEIVPYVAAGLEDRAIPGEDNEELQRYLNLGADFRYSLTSALTAQFTVQPDFGQVEADPALLNLSPFETFYAEQRPFFVEGARFFEHPDFNLFYSRRIGTGEPGSRIRTAAKLTGKLDQQTNVGILGAITDVTHPEQIHNLLKGGERETGYLAGRMVRELDGGRHRFGVMGTGVWRADGTSRARDAMSFGTDWVSYLGDRDWRASGSFVFTSVEPHASNPQSARGTRQGTGGRLTFERSSGVWRGGLVGRFEHDRLDPNDIGFLSANDEIASVAWGQYRFDADGADSPLKASYTYLQARVDWLYGDQRRLDADGQELWAYDNGHHQGTSFYLDTWNQFPSYHEFTMTAEHTLPGTSKHETRFFDGQRGPLLETPGRTTAEIRFKTDWRRDIGHEVEFEYGWTPRGSHFWEADWFTRFELGQHLSTRVSIGYQDRHDDSAWLLNEPYDGGIGGVGYVFATRDQRTLDATIRAAWLPDRDTSVELYLNPYLTAGEHRDPRFLARPDTRDLRPYDRGDGTDPAAEQDFTFAALNLNLVTRWEYRPGSTFYFVITHGREHYDQRQFQSRPDAFAPDLAAELLFDQEPRTTALVKLDYWFSL